MPQPEASNSDNSYHFASLHLDPTNTEERGPSSSRARYDHGDTIDGAADSDLNLDYVAVNHDELRDSITRELFKTQIGLTLQGHYLSDDRLKTLFTKKAVLNALGPPTDRRLADYVVQDAMRTFATLLLVFTETSTRRKAMQILQGRRFTDATLTRALPKDASEGLRLCEEGNCSSRDPGCEHYFPYKTPWNVYFLDEFKKKSAHFQMESFKQSKFVYEMNRDLHLPIVKNRYDIGSRSGHFSEVTCVEMLTDKQDKVKSSTKSIVVALKTLKRLCEKEYNIETEWSREAAAYKRLNDNSKQIIQGIAAVHLIDLTGQNDTYHLILEWADGGNLQEFQKSHPQRQIGDDPERSASRVMELLEQLYGLADALHYMHTSIKSTGISRHSRPDSPSLSSNQSSSSGRVSSNPIDTLPSPSTGHLATPKIEIQAPDDLEGLQRDADVHRPGAPPPAHRSRSSISLQSENWRHGDIKPENILRFLNGKQVDDLGTLKLADLGRAQLHEQITKKRTTSDEVELWRTRWYEPPDLFDESRKKISRLFDLWSMGCVIFESVLWFLYGIEAIEGFVSANELDTHERSATPYWRKTKNGRFEVTTVASKWMDHILQNDPERDCALGHIVKLVKERLLQIEIPDDSGSYRIGYRTNAEDLKEQLGAIIERGREDHKYLFSGVDRANATFPQVKVPGTASTSSTNSGSSLSPHDAERSLKRVPGRATTIAMQRDYTNSLKDDWNASEDAHFVKAAMPNPRRFSEESDYCKICRDIDLLSPSISFDVQTLKMNTAEGDCDLCELVSSVISPKHIEEGTLISLERVSDAFVIKGTLGKVLRLCQTGTANSAHLDVPIGVPYLAAPHLELNSISEGTFLELLRSWLQVCDKDHGALCRPIHPGRKLPRRLINVKKSNRTRLTETTELDKELRYIAFSHRWGTMPAGAVTTKDNVGGRMQRLHVEGLPKSFNDAMAVTRALDCEYLWVDSLCILQGSDGDFNEQADTMQDTFSNAYCVIAACNADSSSNGFLNSVPSKYIKKGDIYLSSVTNDFERDVLQSPLNRRGWVLQERALARRTIFFTKSQMYYECGDGIRCETLAKIKNDQVAFLGDPNFPNYTIREDSTRGSQIHLFTRLFEMYTKLEFSHPEDIPIAIDGLMHRLTVVFKTHSLAGLFHAFWGRCLLWKRAGTGPLRRIPPGPHTKRMPPSWSWMAFEGAISFLDPVGGTVDWNESGQQGVSLPFENRAQSSWLKTSNRNDSNALSAHVFGITHALATASENEAYVSFDGAQMLPIGSVKCFIVGTEKQPEVAFMLRKRYVVLVRKKEQLNESVSYERVGVGHLLGKYVRFEEHEYASID
ncbi:HET-domain-containing protein [Plenodomus tracheiphilus IPT5]|uniref:HET-domain-containing protein n=1 Tax=Plenodomus tracheiphilus IPT5 TaxID=1408161 RepID=A0A6A7B2H1_9PLEO|nr:HET-domain-containing protein [Plenodomus tracheiphilus IPT5]